jgi:hypothetical protein
LETLGYLGCPIYIHVPKEKRIKLDTSGRNGTFVGYNESSKEYRIYIPGQRQIEVSRDVTFEEEVSFKRSRGPHMEIDQIDPIDPVDLVAPVDVPRDIAVGRVAALYTPGRRGRNLQSTRCVLGGK